MEDQLLQNSLSKVERQRTILNLLSGRKTITLKELENHLYCSRITVQRDLVELENKGFLNRVHGGATLKDFDLAAYDHDRRLLIHSDKKKEIARKAMELVQPNMFLFLDSSSTCYFLSDGIFPDQVRIVTTGLDTFLNLQKNRNVQAILTGGRINPRNRTLVGPEAISVVRQFFFNLVFLSADSLITERGVFCSDEAAAAIARASIEHGEQKVLLFDSSKIPIQKGVKICDFETFDALITDEPDNPALQNLFPGKII